MQTKMQKENGRCDRYGVDVHREIENLQFALIIDQQEV